MTSAQQPDTESAPSAAAAALSVPHGTARTHGPATVRGVIAIGAALLVSVVVTSLMATGQLSASVVVCLVAFGPALLAWTYGHHQLLFGHHRANGAQRATSIIVSCSGASVLAFGLGAAAVTVLRPAATDVVQLVVCRDPTTDNALRYVLDPTAPTLALVRGTGSAGPRGAAIVEAGARLALRDNRALLTTPVESEAENDALAKAFSDALRAASTEVFSQWSGETSAEAALVALRGSRLVVAGVGAIRVGLWRNAEWASLTTEPSETNIGVDADVAVDLVAVDLIDGDVVVALVDGGAFPVSGDAVDPVTLAAVHGGAAVLRYHPLSAPDPQALPLSCSSSTMQWPEAAR